MTVHVPWKQSYRKGTELLAYLTRSSHYHRMREHSNIQTGLIQVHEILKY